MHAALWIHRVSVHPQQRTSRSKRLIDNFTQSVASLKQSYIRFRCAVDSSCSMSALLESFKSSADKMKSYSTDNPTVVAGGVAVAVSGVYLLSKYLTVNTTDAGRKGSLGLSLGKESNGDSAWTRFASSWSQGHKQAEGGTGAGNMHDPSKAASVVNDFYSFVTDIYEWGWGASFHFAPKIWSHDWKAGEACQEVRIAHMLRATPGMKVLDVGCGVGGPMRIVAASTGAHITGITISEYQVERCKKLNAKVCPAVAASFP